MEETEILMHTSYMCEGKIDVFSIYCGNIIEKSVLLVISGFCL
jgi:hypothetical protein